jgi:hypothetical protein
LGEHLSGRQEVTGSSPVNSTIVLPAPRGSRRSETGLYIESISVTTGTRR